MTDVTVFVSTLDQWAAVWPGFIHGMKRYWPDCPWPVAFSTEEADTEFGHSLKVGCEEQWGARNRKALQQISSPVILFMIDDFWLCDPVETDKMVDFSNVVLRNLAHYIALAYGHREMSDGDFYANCYLFERGKRDYYRLALQASFWDRETLISLLNDDTTPWTFEQAGQKRSIERDLVCLATHEWRFLKYVERNIPEWESGAVIRGKWQPAAIKYAAREGLTFDFSINPDGSPAG